MRGNKWAGEQDEPNKTSAYGAFTAAASSSNVPGKYDTFCIAVLPSASASTARLRAVAAEQHNAGVEVVARRRRAAQALGLHLVGRNVVGAGQAFLGELLGRAPSKNTAVWSTL
jgi:hypothetical protein